MLRNDRANLNSRNHNGAIDADGTAGEFASSTITPLREQKAIGEAKRKRNRTQRTRADDVL